MKEKIYTIPVTDAFRIECECCMCILEKQLEDEAVDYVLGPSLMEPDHRTKTNENGFCQRHFEQLYNKQENRLGLGLIIDTHLSEQNARMKKMYTGKSGALERDSKISLVKNVSNKLSSKPTETEKFVDDMIAQLAKLEGKCTICGKIGHTMDRYIDVILYLWFKEEDFKAMFNSKKAFCLKHFRELLEGAKKHLNVKEMALFTDNLVRMQLGNMERIQQEVNWFTKKFDYRNNEAPWGNSKDAIPRSIQKIVGSCDFK